MDNAAYARAGEREAAGAWFSQSESSAMPIAILNPQPSEHVLDVASGRGNKAIQIGARMGGDGTLLCIERDERKAEVLKNRLAEAGVTAGIVIGDAATELLEPTQRFDRALVDAPCSGLGILGRHPRRAGANAPTTAPAWPKSRRPSWSVPRPTSTRADRSSMRSARPTLARVRRSSERSCERTISREA